MLVALHFAFHFRRR